MRPRREKNVNCREKQRRVRFLHEPPSLPSENRGRELSDNVPVSPVVTAINGAEPAAMSALCLPLISHGRPLGTLVVASLQEENFPEKDAELLRHVANQIAIAVENSLAFRQVVDRANRLSEERLYLQDEIRTEHNFEEIIGESAALKLILRQIATVAPTDSTILIQGEFSALGDTGSDTKSRLALRQCVIAKPGLGSRDSAPVRLAGILDRQGRDPWRTSRWRSCSAAY
ncbi:MAG TPA: GAF domain-containing protein [Verrucomicrobiae bacterium]|nr:GAF domain-containing protein [Verrucomicrobiae bacterium]